MDNMRLNSPGTKIESLNERVTVGINMWGYAQGGSV